MTMSVLTPKRVRLYAVGTLAAIVTAFVVSVVSGERGRTLTGRLGGDFPAFYGAARIVAAGDAAELYVNTRQRAAQQDLVSTPTGFLMYAYPPYVAVAYAPLALLPYRLAYVINTILMLAALMLSVHLLRRQSRLIDEHFLPALALAILFYPLLKATLGGQNTSVTLLLIVLSWRSALAEREGLTGAWLGLLLYKPQFAVPLIGLFVLSGRWKVGVASAIVGAVLYGASALVMGPAWFVEWFAFARWFSNVDAGLNQQNAISWLGFLQAVLGTESRAAFVAGGTLTVLTIVGVSWLWGVAGRRGDPSARMAVTVPCLVLMSPHAMYYEMGVCLFTYAVVLDRSLPQRSALVVGILFLGASQAYAGAIGFSPLFALAVLTLAFACVISWGPATEPLDSMAPCDRYRSDS